FICQTNSKNIVSATRKSLVVDSFLFLRKRFFNRFLFLCLFVVLLTFLLFVSTIIMRARRFPYMMNKLIHKLKEHGYSSELAAIICFFYIQNFSLADLDSKISKIEERKNVYKI